MISAILAISENGAIGKDNALPWPHIPEDMKWFKQNTIGKCVVMGSKTWESLGKYAPLPKRMNYVISSRYIDKFPGALGTLKGENLGNKLKAFAEHKNEEFVIIGGAEIYKQCFPACDILYISRIKGNFDGDTFLDLSFVPEEFNLVHEVDNNERVLFEVWERK